MIRPSGTEPKVRVMIEGKDKERIDTEAHRIADLIQQLMLNRDVTCVPVCI